MIAIKGRYDGVTVTFDKPPTAIRECDVIVTFLDTADDGSLDYLFRDYKDDGVREPIVDFCN